MIVRLEIYEDIFLIFSVNEERRKFQSPSQCANNISLSALDLYIVVVTSDLQYPMPFPSYFRATNVCGY